MTGLSSGLVGDVGLVEYVDMLIAFCFREDIRLTGGEETFFVGVALPGVALAE